MRTTLSRLMAAALLITALSVAAGSASASIFYNLEVSADSSGATVEMGESRTYNMTIRNGGLFPDTIYIQSTMPPQGWSIFIERPVVQLKAGASQIVAVTITSTGMTDVTQSTIRVTAVSSHESSQQGHIDFVTRVILPPEPEENALKDVQPYILLAAGALAVIGIPLSLRSKEELELSCDDPEQIISIGESAIYEIIIKNRWKRPTDALLSLGKVPEGWSILLETPSMLLQPREASVFTVTVIPPQDGMPSDDAEPIVVIASSKTMPDKRFAITLLAQSVN